MLQRAPVARVIQTSSSNSYNSYSYQVATDLETLNGCKEPYAPSIIPLVNHSYGQSKLAQIIWAKTLAKRLGPNSNIYVNAFHPGVVNTEIWDKGVAMRQSTPALALSLLNWLRRQVLWTPAEGALTGHYLGVAVDRLVKNQVRGKFFHPQSQEVQHPNAQDDELGEKLLDFSDALIKDFV